MITVELVKELFTNYKGFTDILSIGQIHDLSKYLVGEINQLDSLRKSIKNLRSESSKILEESKKNQTEIQKKISELQKTCVHISNTFHADPSGNNDSYYECLICGKNY